MNKKILIFFIISLGLIFLITIVLSFFSGSNTPTKQSATPPTITPINTPTPAIGVSLNDLDKVQDKITNRQALSDTDSAVKQKLLQQVLNDDGLIYQTDDLSVYYDSDFNDFEIEIQSTQLDAAKQEAIQWLQSQGLSNEGICNLPIVFMLGGKATQQSPTKTTVFNPLPDFCQ